MLDAVLFDFNGVLVDDEHLHLACFNAVLLARGITITEAEYEARYIGFDDRGAFDAMLHDQGRQSSRDVIDALIAEKSVEYARLAATQLKVFDGAAALVRSAAAVCRVAVVSGALRAEIDGALAVMGVAGCVARIVAAEDVHACKPDPAGYLMAIEALRARPAHTAAIEDTVFGVRSARAAGVRVAGVVNGAPEGQAERLREAGADAVFARTRDIQMEGVEAMISR